MFGISEGWVILLVVLILFGSTSIPKLARALGKAKTEYKEGMKEAEKEKKD
jgi:sec-independent protein translocase protein TatA